MIKKIKAKLGALVLQNEGGKRILNKKHASIAVIIFSAVALASQLLPPLLQSDIPKGNITKSDTSLIKEKSEAILRPSTTETNQQNIGGVTDPLPPQKPVIVAHHFKPIRYKGKQVIGPDANAQKIPSGASFVGKLLTSIDTRSQQRVHVMLPYGGSHKSGGGSLPSETILMGQFSYSGEGERVFILFNRAVLPDGQEIAIQAQALSSKDYRVGVIGDYHGNKGSQMASVIGLSMVSGISEVMVEKQGLGQSFNVAPKSTLKNGIYNGVAKVTETEANDQAIQLTQTPKYVTIDSGADVIISLGESFGTNERQE
jgi:hypothetical protein